MLIIKEEKGRKDGEIFVELIKNRDLSVTDCDRLGYWCDKPHMKHFVILAATVFTYEELEKMFNYILKAKERKPKPFEPKDGDILCFSNKCAKAIFIFKRKTWLRGYYSDAAVLIRENKENTLMYNTTIDIYVEDITLATEQEKQIIFNELEKDGRRWNPEKKRIEDIPEEPKIGDYVIAWDNNKSDAIIGVLTNIATCSTFPYMVCGDQYKNIILWDGTKEHFEKVRKGEA